MTPDDRLGRWSVRIRNGSGPAPIMNSKKGGPGISSPTRLPLFVRTAQVSVDTPLGYPKGGGGGGGLFRDKKKKNAIHDAMEVSDVNPRPSEPTRINFVDDPSFPRR